MLWACAVPVLLELETSEPVKHGRGVDVRAPNHGKVRASRHLQISNSWPIAQGDSRLPVARLLFRRRRDAGSR
jgi:hypothetical protein